MQIQAGNFGDAPSLASLLEDCLKTLSVALQMSPNRQGRSQKFTLGGYNFYCTILQSYM